MPVIVVGADTRHGQLAIEALSSRPGEIRAFVTDPAVAARLKAAGVKVATGDISDGSHIGGAALNAFTAVLVETAARDDRARSFASTPAAVVAAWAEGIGEAGIRRVIWVGTADEPPPELAGAAPELHALNTNTLDDGTLAAEIARLDDAGPGQGGA